MTTIPASLRPASDARRAYGLRIRSAIPLDELVPCPAARTEADLVVSREPPRPVDAPFGATFDAHGVRLAWPAVGAFRVDAAGRSVVATPAPEASDVLVALPLAGPVMACVLHLRERFVLHASAIRVGAQAVALLGDKGAGKSSTACALLNGGHALVADDLTVVDPSAAGHVVPAGSPQMKLDDAALARLHDPGARVLAPAHPSIPKHRVAVSRVADETTPLARLYVLERGDAVAVTPLAREAALRTLLRFAYVARFGPAALADGRAAAHLRRATALADAGVVHRLVVPDGLHRLPDAVAAIERDVGGAARQDREAIA